VGTGFRIRPCANQKELYGILNQDADNHDPSEDPEGGGNETMLAFQLIGLALVALFFGAMVTGQQGVR